MTPLVRSVGLAAVLALFAAACGAPAATTPAPTAPTPAPVGDLPRRDPVGLEYVVLRVRWVEEHVPVEAATLEAWATDPKNAAAVAGPFRHVLFAVKANASAAETAAAEKKAAAVLARLGQQGRGASDDFAAIARKDSDDGPSRDAGGICAAARVATFDASIRDAFAKLAPGTTSTVPIRSSVGVHVVRKDRLEGDALERAFRHAHAPETTRALGAEVLRRLRGPHAAREAVADAVVAVLGERANADESRPTVRRSTSDHLDGARLPAAARAALVTFAEGAKAGDVLPSPAVDGDTVVVARVVAGANRNDSADAN